MKIQAAVTHVCAAPFQIETVDLAEPKSGEILVKIAACGVCHTDESAQNEQVPTKLPAVLGHEGAGVVEKVGPNVTEFQPGDRVGFSFAYCGQCPACRNSKVSSCRDFNKINFGGVLREGTSRLSQNGQPLSMFFGQSAFAEYAVADAESAVKVPYEDIDLGLVAPLGCGIQTGAGTVLNRLKPKFGKTDFKTMTPMDLKESIFKSEGRVIMGQHLLFDGKGLVRGIKAHLESKGIEVIDVGTNSPERFNYPISGYKVAKLVASGE